MKHTNPFKMIGPYAGILAILGYFYFNGRLESNLVDELLFKPASDMGYLSSIAIYATLIAGFLIGWVIESMIKRKK
jgi:hypothetical protein